jgi:hypothetical protein
MRDFTHNTGEMALPGVVSHSLRQFFVFNELGAIHAVIHTVKPILGAVSDAILSSFSPDSELSRR